jgi:hypothetical protein
LTPAHQRRASSQFNQRLIQSSAGTVAPVPFIRRIPGISHDPDHHLCGFHPPLSGVGLLGRGSRFSSAYGYVGYLVHLGEHATAESALESWPQETQELQSTRPRQADKLQSKLEWLQEPTEGDERCPNVYLTPRLTPSDTTIRGVDTITKQGNRHSIRGVLYAVLRVRRRSRMLVR